MIDLACPNCGRAGSIPREKINTRLVCKKCHVTFHMNTAGRTLLGEPHQEVGKPAVATHDGPRMPSLEGLPDLKASLPAVSLRTLLLSVAAVVVGGGLFMLLTKPPQPLVDQARLTAERFANDDLAYLKEIASGDTVDDVVRWFDAKHPDLVKARETWKSKEAKVEVMVVGEDRKERRGEALAFIYPKLQGSAHSKDVTAAADASNIGAAQAEPVNLKLHWVLDGSGRWRLDGRQTLTAANAPTL